MFRTIYYSFTKRTRDIIIMIGVIMIPALFLCACKGTEAEETISAAGEDTALMGWETFDPKAENLETVTYYYDAEGRKLRESALLSETVSGAVLELTLSVAEGDMGEAEDEYLILRLEYEWFIRPETKTADPLFLSWEQGTAVMRDDSFFFWDQQVDPNGEVQTYQSTSYYAVGGGSGCQWYADIDEAKRDYGLRGSGMICIVPSQPAGSLELQGLYVRINGGANLSCEITPSGAVNITKLAGEGEYTQFPVRLTVPYDLTD